MRKLGILFFLLVLIPCTLGHQGATHRTLSSAAVTHLGLVTESSFSCVLDYLLVGAEAEDEPWTRSLAHFEPALPGISCGAIEWGFTRGITQWPATITNDFTWDDAVLHRWSTQHQGWTDLGYVLHLLEDMSSPAHVRQDKHPPGNSDPYESINAGRPFVMPAKSSGVKYFSSPQDYLQNLQTYTRNNYYSGDTVFEAPGPAAAFEDNDYFYDASFRKIAYKSTRYRWSFPKDRTLCDIDSTIALEQYDELAPLTVQYAAGLIKHYIDYYQPTLPPGCGSGQQPTWTQKFLSSKPPARFSRGMVYDAARGETLLFGGCCGPSSPQYPNPYLNDTWVWNGSNWTQKFPSIVPPARYEHAMAYDDARGEVVMIGGFDRNGFALNDTWVWNGSNWTQKFPSTSPSPSITVNHTIVYDAARREIVMHAWDQTWVWNGSNWIQRFPATSPAPRAIVSMAYDTARAEVVLFGGAQFYNDTWIWNGSNWIRKFPATSPAPRAGAGMAYDILAGEMVLYGGFWLDPNNPGQTLTDYNDTWVWNGSNWTQKFSTASPPTLTEMGMAYDALRQQVVLFGGVSLRLGNLDQTWVYPR